MMMDNDNRKKYTKIDNEENNASYSTVPSVGIDLGTSNSTVAYYQGGKIHYLEVRNRKLIPSAIYFASRDKTFFGDGALRRGIIHPESLVKHFKRHIGENEKFKYVCEDQENKATDTQKKTYVIDTNVFIDNPFILDSLIEEGAGIIVPMTVYEELGRRKSDINTSPQAEAALEQIEAHRPNIEVEDSDMDNLPGDFFKSTDHSNNDRNDSKIISVAYKYNDENTILLSSDKGLREKASWLKPAFKMLTYKEFEFYKNAQTNEADNILLSGKDAAVIFLKYLRDEINKKLGDVQCAVITAPQKFSPMQTAEIKEAGLEAGFAEVEIHQEPIAAAVAYGLDQETDKNILVYDFGGGTFDVSIIRQENGDFHVLGADGDAKLGGEDFTQKLVEEFKDNVLDEYELDLASEEESGLSHDEFRINESKIWVGCERLKCDLSELNTSEVTITLYVKPGVQKNVDFTLSRDDFENITYDLIEQSKKKLDSVLKKANLNRSDIDTVIMAGGTSSIPSIHTFVEQYFGKAPYSDKNPATLIAEGAAAFADKKWNQNSSIDKKIAIYNKTLDDFGVATLGHHFDCIIPADTELPVRQPKVYSLVKDNQQELRIELFTRDKGSEAQKTMDDSINYIGAIEIKNLPPARREDIDVEVTFELTKEYVLEASVAVWHRDGKPIKKSSVTIERAGI